MANKQKNPRERFSYLRELVTEFQDSSSIVAKEQVLANLANFAYDPDNYSHFRDLNIVDLFLDQLDEDNENFVEFAIGGISNLALGKSFKEYICKNGGISHVINCLSSKREETVLSAVTTLMFLVYPESKAVAKKKIECQKREHLSNGLNSLILDIINPSVIDCMLRFQESNNRRLKNLASVFLQDYCSPQDVQKAKQLAFSNERTS